MVECLKRLVRKDRTTKTKAEIKEIALVVKEYNNLKQRADELEVQLNHEREQNAALMQGRSTKMQETVCEKTTFKVIRKVQPILHVMLKDRIKMSSKFGWFQNNSLSKELPIQRASSSASRKPAKDDLIGAKNDNSTFSKLTTRLNYLKERRNQIASELENMDKGHSSSSRHNSGHTKAPEPLQINCCG
ncbi:hypothetical protein Cgig2_003593 [Carnegiea gigantea]|uniref:Uncharacterized protein n=1 Tax=Carnegiea gigantea TaxID=171969 RepID=A0A9Q1QDD5_9CARY|nr:hypothetical protein Cgig2_003593 [Carnegiea gigantea]